MAAAAKPPHFDYSILTHAHVGQGWKARHLELSEAEKRMLRNTAKAFREHLEAATAEEKAVYAPTDEALPKDPGPSPLPLAFAMNDFKVQGPRPSMEDAHFYQESDNDILTGVFDGHGGPLVSQFAAQYTQHHFPTLLASVEGNVHAAFERIFDAMHHEIKEKHPDWTRVGTTALICYIDKKTHRIYTATLGDSEANIYRKHGGTIKSFPLSCVRSWYSDKDSARLAKAHEVPCKGQPNAPEWLISTDPRTKWLRSTGMLSSSTGLNVSRALGDLSSTVNTTLFGSQATFKSEELVVIHKPKITVYHVQPDDVLILACDGVKDFLQEHHIQTIVSTPSILSFAEQIGYAALGSMFPGVGGDNITILSIKVSERK